MQNRNNKRRQEKKLEKQKAKQEILAKQKELEKKEEEVVVEKAVAQEAVQETVQQEKQDTPQETKAQEEVCCECCECCEEPVEEPVKEAACCKENPQEQSKAAEVKAKDNSSYGEFFIGLTIGAVLLALGALIVFLFQVDYLRGLEKKVNELQNSSAKSEIKTDLKAVKDHIVSLEKKVISADSSARFQDVENKVVVLNEQLKASKEDAKKFATLDAFNQKLEALEKSIASQKEDFAHFKNLQEMNYLEIHKKIEERSFAVKNTLEEIQKQWEASKPAATPDSSEKLQDIQKQLDTLKQNDSKALEMKLEFLQTTLQTFQQQHNELLESVKKLKEQVEKMPAPSTENKQ
ncbi:MAG: hypothetical protein HUU50_04485 [Candidatus Brocadiae bacterium]|nr:hypothetical protein [Candidatus Brocadiia bacterium]